MYSIYILNRVFDLYILNRLFDGRKAGAKVRVAAWTTPNADLEVCESNDLAGASVSARLLFVATDVVVGSDWYNGVNIANF